MFVLVMDLFSIWVLMFVLVMDLLNSCVLAPESSLVYPFEKVRGNGGEGKWMKTRLYEIRLSSTCVSLCK